MQDQDRQSLSETLQSRVRELEDDLDQIRNSLPDLANSNTPISSIATHLQTSLSSISDLQQEVSCLKEKLQHAEEARMKYEDHINVLKGKNSKSIHFIFQNSFSFHKEFYSFSMRNLLYLIDKWLYFSSVKNSITLFSV